MRQNFNFHTHTFRCGHATICEDEQYVLKALENGFEYLGFSDHAPYPDKDKDTDRMAFSKFDDYLTSIKQLKEKYQDQIKIFLGCEMEYFDCYDEYIDNFLAPQLDYLILGQHYKDSDAEFDYYTKQSDKEALLEYARLVTTALTKHKWLFLAHPDYYCASIDTFDENCAQVAHAICKTCVETDTPMELNIKFTSRLFKDIDGLRQRVYPLRKFWEIASQYPVKVLYGFDAHDPSIFDLQSEMYEIVDEIIKDLPLNFINESPLK